MNTPRTQIIAHLFIEEISDGWGDDVEKKDTERLTELFSPIEQELIAEQEKVKELREALQKSQAIALSYAEEITCTPMSFVCRQIEMNAAILEKTK